MYTISPKTTLKITKQEVIASKETKAIKWYRKKYSIQKKAVKVEKNNKKTDEKYRKQKVR